MKKFAYLDNAEILHITKSEGIAKAHSGNGKVVMTEFPAKGGYPIDNVGNYYVLYSEKEDKHGKKIPYELEQLYLACK